MKKIILMLFVAVAMTSCVNIKGPYMTTVPMVTKNSGTKEGVTTRTIWFGLAFGHTDLSLITAAKNGGISKIATVDFEYKSGLFRTIYTVKVTGE